MTASLVHCTVFSNNIQQVDSAVFRYSTMMDEQQKTRGEEKKYLLSDKSEQDEAPVSKFSLPIKYKL